MRVLMLQSSAGHQHVCVDQGLDHGLVGITLLALVIDDALSREAARVIGEGTILIDRVGYRRIDAARFQLARIRRPDVEVFAAMPWGSMHEAGAGILCDVFACKK